MEKRKKRKHFRDFKITVQCRRQEARMMCHLPSCCYSLQKHKKRKWIKDRPTVVYCPAMFSIFGPPSVFIFRVLLAPWIHWFSLFLYIGKLYIDPAFQPRALPFMEKPADGNGSIRILATFQLPWAICKKQDCLSLFPSRIQYEQHPPSSVGEMWSFWERVIFRRNVSIKWHMRIYKDEGRGLLSNKKEWWRWALRMSNAGPEQWSTKDDDWEKNCDGLHKAKPTLIRRYCALWRWWWRTPFSLINVLPDYGAEIATLRDCSGYERAEVDRTTRFVLTLCIIKVS